MIPEATEAGIRTQEFRSSFQYSTCKGVLQFREEGDGVDHISWGLVRKASWIGEEEYRSQNDLF